MKELLGTGGKDMYQIARVFRANEHSAWHHPEFLMLEWYRCDFSLDDLKEDTVKLLHHLGWQHSARCWSLEEAFETLCHIDLHDDLSVWQSKVADDGIDAPEMNRAQWRDFLHAHYLEPALKPYPLVILHDFLPEDASLATLNERNRANRMELYLHGIECGNGFEELRDADEQRRRFEQAHQAMKTPPPMPETLLSALAHMPPCSGIAIGLERIYSVLNRHTALQRIGDPMFHVKHRSSTQN